MLPYTLTGIKRTLRDPRLAFWELLWLYHTRIRDSGIPVMKQDWDNLVILDACRYDLFEAVNMIPGRLEQEYSRGSHTADFLQRNFGDESFPDTVYVCATPQFLNHEMQSHFHDSVHLWETDWDSELQTVPPKAVVRTTLDVHEEYPNKRLISHFLQPHYPFIGETGQQIQQGTMTGGGILTKSRDHPSIWELLEAGVISEQTVWKAYEENLELVLRHVEQLLSELPGKTVVTSDHGNAFGKYGVYGHPRKHYFRELTEVPWLTVEADKRRRIECGELSRGQSSAVEIKEQLQALGYK